MTLEALPNPYRSGVPSWFCDHSSRLFCIVCPSSCSQQMAPPALKRVGSVLGHGSALALTELFLKQKGQYSAIIRDKDSVLVFHGLRGSRKRFPANLNSLRCGYFAAYMNNTSPSETLWIPK